MQDTFGRKITYMRLSVTDLCNLRCRYCMPEEGIAGKLRHPEMLTEDEMIDAVKAAASLGVSKIRLTGGEPLIKKNIVSICRRIHEIPGITQIAITTNGTLLPRYALPLKEAGLDRVNISLDTLVPEKYARMTRRGNFDDAWKGLMTALDTGFERVKINAVLIGGFNDDEIEDLAGLTLKYPVDMRFIELMPMYDSGDFGQDALIPGETVLRRLPELQEIEAHTRGQVAKMYRFPDAPGRVGLINPLSHAFCSECNRIRLTADGKLKPCLHSRTEIPIKGLDLEGMKEKMKEAILAKPGQHEAMDAEHRSDAGRNMNEIGG
ncbi:MAG: GTP 3',8-cyclase MoaA [Lachnospiraceae bacterium]|nr:GTP 3',8-cyclase MoaA [Lachnospiraceae bacterium]